MASHVCKGRIFQNKHSMWGFETNFFTKPLFRKNYLKIISLHKINQSLMHCRKNQILKSRLGLEEESVPIQFLHPDVMKKFSRQEAWNKRSQKGDFTVFQKKVKRHLINFSEGKQKSVILTVCFSLVVNIPATLNVSQAETMFGLYCPFCLLVNCLLTLVV